MEGNTTMVDTKQDNPKKKKGVDEKNVKIIRPIIASILACLCGNKFMTSDDIATALNIRRENVRFWIKKMVHDNLLIECDVVRKCTRGYRRGKGYAIREYQIRKELIVDLDGFYFVIPLMVDRFSPKPLNGKDTVTRR